MTSCPSNQDSSIVSLYKGSLAGNGEEGFKKENLVINSEKSWKEFLVKIDSSNSISSQFENTIDFSKSTILVAVDNKSNTGGVSINISEITQKNSKLLVNIASKGPKPTDMVAMVLTQPIHIVKISKTDKEIVFVTK
jgi:hypothetical protein